MFVLTTDHRSEQDTEGRLEKSWWASLWDWLRKRPQPGTIATDHADKDDRSPGLIL